MSNGQGINYGLLADAFSALGGRSTNYGASFQKMEDERRMREARKRIEAQLLAGGQPQLADVFASSPTAAATIAAQSLATPKVYGDPTKGMYTYEVNPATGSRELQQIVAPQGLGLGSGFQGNVASQVYQLGQKIKGGTATPEDQSLYNFLSQYATEGSVRQIPDPDGTVRTVEVPGISLEKAGLPTPTSVTPAASPDGGDGSKVLGKTPPKFSGLQTNAASFANRMTQANQTFAELTSGDNAYDPTNFIDYRASKLPADIAGFVLSDPGKLYEAQKRNFINAQLRQESGAAIAESEFANAERQYFPIPGDTPEAIEAKRKAREEAVKGMIGTSGGAYGAFFGSGDIPAGAVFLREMGGIKYYRLPDGSIKAID
tara:strand:- start:2549 stop:3670 length:1122 start_codon:yes stop_codon:yes gene_type:complete